MVLTPNSLVRELRPLIPRRFYDAMAYEQYALNRKRPYRVHVYLNEQEYQRLNIMVAYTSLSREQVLRDLINGLTIKAAPVAEYGAIVRELNRIGNNINQIAAKQHSHGFVDEPMLREAVASLQRIEREFTRAFAQES